MHCVFKEHRANIASRPAAGVASAPPRHQQPGLWLIAGGLAQCRIGSKHLALQIKAIEEGLLPRA